MSLDRTKKPVAGKSSLTGPSRHDHGASGVGKRTLTEALPHQKPARRDRDQNRDVDRSEGGGPSPKVKLLAGKPAKAASAPEPEKDDTNDDAKDDAKDEGKDEGKDDDRSGDEAPRARTSRALTISQAIHRYSPVVYMAKDEKFRAANASEFINNSSLNWEHNKRGDDERFAGEHQIDHGKLRRGEYRNKARNKDGKDVGNDIPSTADVRPMDARGPGGDEGFYLDLNNDNRASQRSGTDAPVYYEYKEGHYITYWFFYAYNEGPLGFPAGGRDDHEGDWERICVRLDSNNRAIEVAYYQHDGYKKLPWSKVTTEGETHPVVYSAKGSHASYEKPGKKRLKFHGVPTPVHDHASKGARWMADPIGPADHLKKLSNEAWYGYGGGWGETTDHKESTGPQGPSRFKDPAPEEWE